jgi:uncharacterized membrane-anchored protein YhcB (DUF1043 family)
MVDPLLSPWLMLISGVVVGAFLGIVFERTRGTAAKRAAKFEADLVQARSDLMRYREQTKHHFGKSAELLGKMATDYRDFLDHFVSGAEELCGPNMKEINASGLDRRLLGTQAPAVVAAAAAASATTGPVTAPAANGAARDVPLTSGTAVPIKTVTPTPIKPAAAAPMPMPPPSARAALATDPLAEDVAK